MENSTLKPDLTSYTEEPFEVYTSYYMRQIFAVVCVITSIVGIIGNVFVITAVQLSRKLRTVTNVFVVNLSVSDLLSCIFLPWQAVAVLSEDGWPLPRAYGLCVTTAVLIILSTGCSINNLALIAVNRWVLITKTSATTHRVYTHQNIACMVALSWVLPLCVTLIPPLAGFGELGYEPLYSSCSWVKANPGSFNHSLVVGSFYGPVQIIVITFCYTSIFLYVLRTSRRMARHNIPSVSGAVSGLGGSMRQKLRKRQIAVTKNLVYIFVAFFVCLFLFLFALVPIGKDWSIRMTPFLIAIVYCNCIVDPLIYAVSHPDFKEAFGYMIRCKCGHIPQTSARTF